MEYLHVRTYISWANICLLFICKRNETNGQNAKIHIDFFPKKNGILFSKSRYERMPVKSVYENLLDFARKNDDDDDGIAQRIH